MVFRDQSASSSQSVYRVIFILIHHSPALLVALLLLQEWSRHKIWPDKLESAALLLGFIYFQFSWLIYLLGNVNIFSVKQSLA